MEEGKRVMIINIDFTENGVWLTFQHVDGTNERVWVNDRWYRNLVGAFTGRIGFLEDHGKKLP